MKCTLYCLCVRQVIFILLQLGTCEEGNGTFLVGVMFCCNIGNISDFDGGNVCFGNSAKLMQLCRETAEKIVAQFT